VPPLRERKDDLLLTARYLIEKWCGKLQKTIPTMSQGFIEVMKSHDWPGNVRELENAIEYAVNVCDDDVLEIRHLPKRIAIGHEQRLSNVPDALQPSIIRSIAQLEEEAIRSAMALYGRSGEALEDVAKILGISRATLYRKIKTYQL
jgi:transcriptional regulator with PAS, ATPase and Fis domain